MVVSQSSDDTYVKISTAKWNEKKRKGAYIQEIQYNRTL